MQMLKIAICDDEMALVSHIEKLILDICAEECILVETDTFYNGNALAERVIQGERFDMIYMDIQMDEGDGITAAENIRKTDEDVVLIYISGYEKYMLRLFLSLDMMISLVCLGAGSGSMLFLITVTFLMVTVTMSIGKYKYNKAGKLDEVDLSPMQKL